VAKPGLDFSFSGLKTYTLTTLQSLGGIEKVSEQDKCDIARAFEDAVVDTLIIKCRRALEQTGLDTLVMAGGVSANKRLRGALGPALAPVGAQVYYPEPKYCTDNGAMIAYAGACRLASGQSDEAMMNLRPRWPLSELQAI